MSGRESWHAICWPPSGHQHWFGLHPPKDTFLVWGARAIFTMSHYTGTKPVIDLLPDRQSFHGEDRLPLVKWINDKGLPGIKEVCHDTELSTGSDETVSFREGGWVIKASPKASYGYLYLAAYPEVGE